MIPSIEHVIKKRHHNRRRLRFMALILVVIGWIWISWGLLGLLTAIWSETIWSTGAGLLIFGGGFILPAIPLWFFDERIGRALVPMPRFECPVCRYNLTGLTRAVCPECGLTLPLVYLKYSAAKDKTSPTDASRGA
jgi:hypothetical protein